MQTDQKSGTGSAAARRGFAVVSTVRRFGVKRKMNPIANGTRIVYADAFQFMDGVQGRSKPAKRSHV
jgi:hypothetical protein